MEEILTGVYHWTAVHPDIHAPVSSYYIEPLATVIDPIEPESGFGWFEGRNVHRACLTNRHHYRNAAHFAEHFGVPVLVDEPGLDDVKDEPGIQSFEFGTEIAPDITCHGPIDPSWPDEGVLELRIGNGILSIGDGCMHYGEEIGFAPDEHLGADPARTKELLRAGYGRLLDLDFDVLLFAHGTPITEGGKERLRAFVHGEEG